MMISHILYKVDDLEKGVKLFKDKGFEVEYGSEKNPHNALVYFNDGSYVEILKSMGFTKMIVGCLADNPTNDFYKHMGGKLIKQRVFEKLQLPENVYLFEEI